jgi:16S rRNA (uracil1498-N3)-methyltransferase
MADRFFVSRPIVGPVATLDGSEAHHLIHVLRAKPGLLVTLFDGHGAEFGARVERVGRKAVELTVAERRESNRELSLRVTLGVALPKQDRQRFLVEKAVELGVTRLVPLLTRRSVSQPSVEAVERLGRFVIEASKQCGRNQLMEINSGQSLDEFGRSHGESPVRWLAHPGGTALPAALNAAVDAISRTTIDEISLAVGPEGGFADEEVAAMRDAGWQLVDLGGPILRIETAALKLAVAASLLANGRER